MFQRRKFPRLNKNFNISYKPVDKEQFEKNPLSSFAVNISGGGICFEAAEELAKGAVVALEINSDDIQTAILALARVAWCRERGEGYEVGAEFWWIGWRDHQTQSNIADFIAANTTHREASV